MTQIIPKSFRIAWSEWQIRVTVLVSLALQFILVLMGTRRKFSKKIWQRFVLWLAYLLADWVMKLSLGVLSSLLRGEDNTADPNHIITAFWAPFLLLHLGGPDTISAYSLEDNELWWRNAVVLGGQIGVVLYIFLNAWSNNVLNFLSALMLVAGTIKLGERIWVLMRASSERFRKSMLPSPDPGPNYARYMDECSSKEAEGFKVTLAPIYDSPIVGHAHHRYSVPANKVVPDATSLEDAYYFFNIFKCLFADLILSIHDIVNSQLFFQNRSCEEVFRVIEIELGFIYDLFYTKALVIYSASGGWLRLGAFSCVACVFGVFSIIDKRAYSDVDVRITYTLLAGAMVLEMYAFFLLLCSDWTMLWMSKHKNRAVDLLYQAISLVSPSEKKRWSNSVGKYNLLGLCLKQSKPSSRYSLLDKAVRFYDENAQNYFIENVIILPEKKEVIFQQLLKKSKDTDWRELCARGADWVLQNKIFPQKLGFNFTGEFDQNILLWHIATDLCFYKDFKKEPNDREQSETSARCPNPAAETSKLLSEYMLYILVMRPFMLPNGIGQIRFQDTCAEATEFFKDRKCTANEEANAYSALLRVNSDFRPSEVKGDRSKSVLFDACRLAKRLQSLEQEQNWGAEKKWELISQVWVGILSYAAGQCQTNQHVQQLRRGGELLTHVWLLMAHLGMTQQFQISDGQARIKLTAL